MRFLFSLLNIGIFSGYLFVAIFIMPALSVQMKRTKIGGPLFFLTCGLTHLDLAIHSWTQTPMDYTSLHALGIHIPQFIAVYMFFSGIYLEFVKGKAKWPPVPPTPGH